MLLSAALHVFTPDSLDDSGWNTVAPVTRKYTANYFSYKSGVGCVRMLNDWFSGEPFRVAAFQPGMYIVDDRR